MYNISWNLSNIFYYQYITYYFHDTFIYTYIYKTSKNKRLNICVLELSRYGRLKIEAKKIDRTISNFRFIFEKT